MPKRTSAKRKKIRQRTGTYPENQKRIEGQKGVILLWMSRGKSFAFGCGKADISYTAGKRWRHDDEAFDLACQEAYEVGTQGLEDIATSRAQRKSDILLMFLLKGRDAKYRDSAKVQVNVEAPKINARRF